MIMKGIILDTRYYVGQGTLHKDQVYDLPDELANQLIRQGLFKEFVEPKVTEPKPKTKPKKPEKLTGSDLDFGFEEE